MLFFETPSREPIKDSFPDKQELVKQLKREGYRYYHITYSGLGRLPGCDTALEPLQASVSAAPSWYLTQFGIYPDRDDPARKVHPEIGRQKPGLYEAKLLEGWLEKEIKLIYPSTNKPTPPTASNPDTAVSKPATEPASAPERPTNGSGTKRSIVLLAFLAGIGLITAGIVIAFRQKMKMSKQ